MLVLSRKIGEVVRIGDDVVVVVIAVRRNQVKLGINAPADVTVDREELAQRKRHQALDAANIVPDAAIAPSAVAGCSAPTIRTVRQRFSRIGVASPAPGELTPVGTRGRRTTLRRRVER